MLWSLKQLGCRSCLYRSAPGHDDNFLSKGQGLDLIVRDIDQGEFQFVVDLFEFASQLPFQMRIDNS